MFLPDQVSSLLRACLRADEQINLKNKLELDISTNEEDIGEFGHTSLPDLLNFTAPKNKRKKLGLRCANFRSRTRLSLSIVT